MAKGSTKNPVIAPYSEGIGVGLVVLVITFLSLVIGELVPKRLALNNAEGVAVRVSRAMLLLSKLTTPLVSLLSITTDFVLKILGAKPANELLVTEEDVQSMISQGTQIGVFDEAEQEMVTQVFRLSDRRVSTLMTPGTDMVFLDLEDELEKINRTITNSDYSRFPVISKQVDNVVGFVRVKDLYDRTVAGTAIDLPSILHPALYLPDAMTALAALEQMKKAGQEIALVIDEYGGLMGLVSLADIMDAIVGDISLPKSGDDPEIIRREDGSLLLGGMILLDELKDVLDVSELPGEEQGYYETLGGMIMTALGRIPSTGDIYRWNGFQFEVMDMDGRRVDKVLISSDPQQKTMEHG